MVNHNKSTTASLHYVYRCGGGFVVVFVLLAWCACAHLLKQDKNHQQIHRSTLMIDDSGSKLRDKEQQRLSSK